MSGEVKGEAIERRFADIGAVLLGASGLLAFALVQIEGGSWYVSWARDMLLFWGAALLLVVGIRALRRSGPVRFALFSTGVGALMFLLAAGGAYYTSRLLRENAEILREGVARETREAAREETQRGIDDIEKGRARLSEAAIGWAISGLLCATVGLFTPIRSRGEGDSTSS